MSERHDPLIYFTAGISAIALLKTLWKATDPGEDREGIYPAPTETYLPHVPPFEQSFLPYPPTGYIEGARDVPTSYGTIRVYEFGPASADRKVLLIHGISTPSPALATLAESLAAKGCRVMLFDLFGRGYSGGPANVRYDGRLYATQIFLALASSPVAWTTRSRESSGRFSIIGYSLGGCIGSNFTSWYPHLVDDLVLISSGGLIRERHFNAQSKFMYSGLIPQSLVAYLVKKRLRSTPNISTRQLSSSFSTRAGASEPAQTAQTGLNAEAPAGAVSVSGENRYVDAEAIVNWQLDHHAGFVAAFVSSIQFAPITGQHARWGLIGRRLEDARRAAADAGRRAAEHVASAPDEGFGLSPSLPKTAQQARDLDLGDAQRLTLRSGKVLMVLGADDSIILRDELVPDATEALGAENVEFKVFEGVGHEVAISRGMQIADSVWEFWNRARRG